MSTPTTETIKCGFCHLDYDRDNSCIGRVGETVYHICPHCRGAASFSIDHTVTAENEYWEKTMITSQEVKQIMIRFITACVLVTIISAIIAFFEVSA